MYTQIADCRLCRATDLIDELSLGMLALTGVFPKTREENVPSGPLALVRCTGCGLVQLKHNYDLSLLYGETYGYRSGLNQSMVQHLRKKVQQIEAMVELSPGDLVVDIGSNDGTLLNSYSIQGLRRIGVDPSGPKFQRYYDPGVQLIPQFFSASAIRNAGAGYAKVITSIAMFYDLERPLEFVEEIMEVLAPEGIWVFEQSYLPSMIETRSYDTICHEHLEYYTLEQILYIARNLDLKIIAVERNNTNGGSFSVAVARQASAYPECTAEIEVLRRLEAEGGYGGPEPMQRLKSELAHHRDELLGFLQNAKREGKTVFGYGASTKGNVLLQYCGITSELMPCVAEVNPDKFGSFTPGTRIPIVSETEARAANPDYFLVLPWHFRDGIVNRESDYLNRGGKLVFPLPRVDVVALAASARP